MRIAGVTDHALAVELWESGNHDARVLASMIADPQQASASLLEGWSKDLENALLADALSGLAAQSASAKRLALKWLRSKNEWISTAGWNVLGRLASAAEHLSESELQQHLATVEATIARAPNRTRYAMNGALIAIGLRSPQLERLAVAAAERIGPVDVDHGETGCKTPYAPEYIRKVADYRGRKKATQRGGQRAAKPRAAVKREAAGRSKRTSASA